MLAQERQPSVKDRLALTQNRQAAQHEGVLNVVHPFCARVRVCVCVASRVVDYCILSFVSSARTTPRYAKVEFVVEFIESSFA